jgi:NAD(P)H-dependent flavin oxidoreductase YrpB (nitropropane dioxygenase family)
MGITDRFRLDVPVGKVGMGGGQAGAPLAAAVAEAGGLGTIGIATPRQLRTSLDLVREQAPGRAVALNLLMPSIRRHQVAVCVDARVDVVVLAFGEKRRLVTHPRNAGIFVLTHEANANGDYQRRIINVDRTIETDLFGFSPPLRHRVVPNAASRRWCDDDGKANALPAALNAAGRPLSVLGYFDSGALMRLQSTARPFSPLPPVAGMPDSRVDCAALYAGETALRIGELTSAGQAVKDLSPR